MNDEHPEKLDLRSHDIAEDKRQELLRLFPEIRTEGGKLDFERLKRALGETVDVGKERYGMNWPGKADCFKTIQQASLATLRPCPEESVNFDTSENLIIEGDNLFDSAIMKTSVISDAFRKRYLSNPKDPNAWEGRAIVFGNPELSNGMVLKPAVKYQKISSTKGVPRDNH